MLKNLDLGDVTTITHAGGQMSEMLKYSIYKFITWDLEGPELKMEDLPKNFLKKTDGVIFVVDKSSDEHVKNARTALHTLMNQKEMQNTVLLVCLGFTNDFVVIFLFQNENPPALSSIVCIGTGLCLLMFPALTLNKINMK